MKVLKNRTNNYRIAWYVLEVHWKSFLASPFTMNVCMGIGNGHPPLITIIYLHSHKYIVIYLCVCIPIHLHTIVNDCDPVGYYTFRDGIPIPYQDIVCASHITSVYIVYSVSISVYIVSTGMRIHKIYASIKTNTIPPQVWKVERVTVCHDIDWYHKSMNEKSRALWHTNEALESCGVFLYLRRISKRMEEFSLSKIEILLEKKKFVRIFILMKHFYWREFIFEASL